MKKNRIFLRIALAGIFCLGLSVSQAETVIQADSDIETKVDSILKKMTLEEKIGQMTQLTLDVVGKGASVYAV